MMRALFFLILAMAPVAMGQAKAQAVKALRLYVFDCGSLNIPDTARYQLQRSEIATNYMSVACFLVAHPKGTLMWDAGAIPDSAFQPGGPPPTAREYATSKRTLREQMAEVGYKAADITYVSFSHFHWDHVANANAFAGSTWLVRKLERDIMFATPPSERTEPANFASLKNSKTTIMQPADYDVFGDGTVVIKSTPGHSPDHTVLFLKFSKTGPVVLSGDLYHYPEERSLNRYPITEHNLEQTKKSRAELEVFLKKTGAALWIQHDYTANAKLKKSPAYYE